MSILERIKEIGVLLKNAPLNLVNALGLNSTLVVINQLLKPSLYSDVPQKLSLGAVTRYKLNDSTKTDDVSVQLVYNELLNQYMILEEIDSDHKILTNTLINAFITKRHI